MTIESYDYPEKPIKTYEQSNRSPFFHVHLDESEQMALFYIVKRDQCLESMWMLAQSYEKMNIQLSYNLLKSWNLSLDHMDDLLSEARLIVVSSICRYEPLTGVKLFTYLWKSVYWALKTYLAHNLLPIKYPRELPADIRIFDDESVLHTMESSSIPGYIVEQGDLIFHVEGVLERMPAEKARIIKRYFGVAGESEQSYAQIGRDEGVTRQAIKARVSTNLGIIRDQI